MADSAEAEVRDSAKAAPVVIHLHSATQTAPAANSFAGTAGSHTVQILLSSLWSKSTARVHMPVVCIRNKPNRPLWTNKMTEERQ